MRDQLSDWYRSGVSGDFHDLAYRAAESGEDCNWEGAHSGRSCGRQGSATIYLNSWSYDLEDLPFMTSSVQLCLCRKHILELVSDLISFLGEDQGLPG